jgi:hypothetical protein
MSRSRNHLQRTERKIVAEAPLGRGSTISGATFFVQRTPSAYLLRNSNNRGRNSCSIIINLFAQYLRRSWNAAIIKQRTKANNPIWGIKPGKNTTPDRNCFQFDLVQILSFLLVRRERRCFLEAALASSFSDGFITWSFRITTGVSDGAGIG